MNKINQGVKFSIIMRQGKLTKVCRRNLVIFNTSYYIFIPNTVDLAIQPTYLLWTPGVFIFYINLATTEIIFVVPSVESSSTELTFLIWFNIDLVSFSGGLFWLLRCLLHVRIFAGPLQDVIISMLYCLLLQKYQLYSRTLWFVRNLNSRLFHYISIFFFKVNWDTKKI